MNSAVPHKVTWRSKSFSTNSTFKRFLSWMTSPVYCKLTAISTAFGTFSTLVPSTMNIHMKRQGILRWITFLTLSTWIHVTSLYCTVYSIVTIQTVFTCKLFVTHSTQIRSWLVIMWMFSDIITVSFGLYLKRLIFILHWTFCIWKDNNMKESF